MKKQIVMLAPHEPMRDPRVHWEAQLAGEFYDVTVLGFQENSQKYKSVETYSNYKIIRETLHSDYTGFLEILRRSFLGIVTSTILIITSTILIIISLLLLPLILVIDFLQVITRPILQKMFTWKIAKFFLRKWSSSNLLWFLKHFSRVTVTLFKAYRRSGVVADIVHSNDLDALLAGVIIKKMAKCSLVYDAHEFWPDSFPDSPRLQIWFLKTYEKILLRWTDQTFTVSPQLVLTMKQWYNITNVGLLPNAAPLPLKSSQIDSGELPQSKMAVSVEKQRFRFSELAAGRIVFLYQGGYAPDRGLEELIYLWERVDGRQSFLAFRGVRSEYSETLETMASDQTRKGKIVFLDPVSESELIDAATGADVGIIPYRPTTLSHKYCCPNKLSQYMQSGLAILSNNLDYVKLKIDEYKCGLSYNSDAPETLLQAVDKFVGEAEFLELCKARSKLAATQDFNWQVVSKPLLEAYHNLSN